MLFPAILRIFLNRSILNNPTRTSGPCLLGTTQATRFLTSESENPPEDPVDDKSAFMVQNVLKHRRDKSPEEIERDLDRCVFNLNDGFVLNVLRRHVSDWRQAYIFFNWAWQKKEASGYVPGSVVYNQILDILGKMKRFEELNKVFDEMPKREGLANEETYRVLVHRYAAAHKVEEAIKVFHKRKKFELESDFVAFQKLIMSLCRYKHVEDAETLLFHSLRNGLQPDIKTWNIILNGWCVRGNVQEAKRIWKEILASKCKPDFFTYGTFINALTKKGKLGTALKIFKSIWDKKGCDQDLVAICNCIMNALCFKKRIPEALEIFKEMNEREGFSPNVATYNTLIKYLSKNRRMDKVYELLNEMEERKGSCLPNGVTFSYLLRSLKAPEEVSRVLERMERNGCDMTSDLYNMVLRLFMEWDDQEGVRNTWERMERDGCGPDRRSYTIMIHGNYDKGREKDALRYFNLMTSKGLVPEPRTEILVNDMSGHLKGKAGKREVKG